MSDPKPLTRSEMVSELATNTGMTKQQINTVFDELVKMVGENLKEGGPGVLNVAGLMKVKVVRKEAQPERKGIDPFTKEERIFKAKPAYNSVKISPLKKLKDAV